MEKHIVKSYARDLDNLHLLIQNMGALTLSQLKATVKSIHNKDEDLALSVIDGDKEVDEFERKIDFETIKLLALRQPMAQDLRSITSAIKIAAALERIGDYAKNISCWADAIVARVFSHDSIQQLAEHASVPVVNALCDLYHPCQALADFVTLSENLTKLGKDELRQVKLAYVGDGNNVSNSLMLMAATLGVDFTLVCPQGCEGDAAMVDKAKTLAQQSGAQIKVTNELAEMGQQDVIYTDTWISMGDEDTTKKMAILAKFAPYQVNHQLMLATQANIVMHCQPAHLEEEITTELFDSEMSVAFQQAENRMWAQNAVLVSLFSEQ